MRLFYLPLQSLFAVFVIGKLQPHLLSACDQVFYVSWAHIAELNSFTLAALY